jgi:hypothetical protein
MSNGMDEQVRAKLRAAAPSALDVLCDIAADHNASVTLRMKSVGNLLPYVAHVNWTADAGKTASIVGLLVAVSKDETRAASTRRKAVTYLEDGVKRGLWKIPA